MRTDVSMNIHDVYDTAEKAQLQLSDLQHILENTIEENNVYCHLLRHLLHALEWSGDLNEFAHSLPHFSKSLDMPQLTHIMEALGYKQSRVACRLPDIHQNLLPAIYITDNNDPMLIIQKESDTVLLVQDGQETAEEKYLFAPELPQKGVLYTFVEKEADKDKAQKFSMRNLFWQHQGLLWQCFIMTMILNCFFLATPLFIKSIYDMAIPAQSTALAITLLSGMGFVMLFMYGFFTLRSHVMLYISGHLDRVLGNEIFKKLVNLPPNILENSAIASQISSLKDFDSTKETLLGPLLNLSMELPAMLIFIGAIAMLGGWLVLVPIVSFALLGVMALLTYPKIKDLISQGSTSNQKRQAFLLEALHHRETIKDIHCEKSWEDHFDDLSAKASAQNYYVVFLNNNLNILSDIILMLTGLATICAGVFMVWAESLTLGSLISSMMLIWRVLSPLKVGFSLLTRLGQIMNGIAQLTHFMNLPREGEHCDIRTQREDLMGDIVLNRVSFRYSADANLAIVGVNLHIKFGETVVLTGPAGSGKSTLLKCLIGLYQPQVGVIQVNHMDIRQIEPHALRQCVAYVSQQPQFFYGTIAQNLRLARPTASTAEIKEVLAGVGLDGMVAKLPEGLSTRLRDQNQQTLAGGFQQRLALARALLNNPSILLVDELSESISNDPVVLQYLLARKNSTTMLFVSRENNGWRFADRIFEAQQGNFRELKTDEPKYVTQKVSTWK